MQAGRLARSAWSAGLDLLFPARCLGCRREGAYLCPECRQRLPRLEPAVQEGGAGPLTGTVAPLAMDGVAREAVHRLKYGGLRAVAGPMGSLMAEQAAASGLRWDLLVPVPLHPRRLRQRGYNQAELLAREVGRRLGVAVERQGLARVVQGPSQARSASREQRKANVQGAFRALRGFAGLSVALVDDVTTTGSTLEACAQTLLEAGARAAWGIAFAREP